MYILLIGKNLTQNLSSEAEILLPDRPLGVEKPYFGEGEDLVRNDFETPFVHLFRPFGVLALQLAPEGVVDPQINVATPMTLVFRRRNVGDSALVDLLHREEGWEMGKMDSR